MNTCNKKNQDDNTCSYKESVKRIGGMNIRIKPVSSSTVNPLQPLKDKI